jgi:hypothetical protein
MPNGIIVIIPTGSDKSYFHKQLSSNDKKTWLDGEKILKKAGIKNKLQYWYDDDFEEITNKITKILYQIKRKGFNIFFSANPLKIKADVIIVTNFTNRLNVHKRNKQNGKWAPSEGLFTMEQQSYDACLHKIPIVFNGDIPNIKTLKSIQYHVNFNESINNNIYTT